MEAEQIAFPFKSVKPKVVKKGPNADLIGRSFYIDSATITVIDLCPIKPDQVMVERDMDGKRWLVPAGLIRLITGQKSRRRVA